MARRILISLLLYLVAVPLWAQQPAPISFVHIGSDNGLSQSTVFDIAQDGRGNMWFATYNGLNRYDGYDFTVYQHDERDAHSIGGDIVRSLQIDSRGRLWAGTYEGLSLYDAGKDCFYNFTCRKQGSKLRINGIVEIDENLLLLCSDEELVLFDIPTRTFTDTLLTPKLFDITPRSVSRQGDLVYVGSYSGLFSYSISRDEVCEIAPAALRGKQILQVLQQSPDRLWVGTEGNGLYLVNSLTGEARSYTNAPGADGRLSSDHVRALAFDSQGRLWVGTIHSLNIYQSATDTFTTYPSNPLLKGSLSQTSVRSIYMDAQGGMWVGTFYGGLNYYHPLKNRFRNLQLIPDANSLNNNTINCITEDSRGNLWVGTNSGGVNFRDARTGKFTHYTKDDGLGSNDVKAIRVDERRGKVYIGSHNGGLSILDRRSGRIETFRDFVYNRPTTIAARSVYAIEPTDDGSYWVGTLDGVVRFNPDAKLFTPIVREPGGAPFECTRIVTVFRDGKQRLWFGSEVGLFIYKEDKSGTLQRLSVLPAGTPLNHRFTNCIHESRSGIFWIGTRSGLYRFDEAKKELWQYTVADGLPNNVVHGILEDSEGKLWISTDKGLAQFTPETGQFRNFTVVDGLQSNQFSVSAYYRARDGQMYFGGVNGITAFYPEQLSDNSYAPSVMLTRLRLFNKEVRPDDASGILTRSISETSAITLTSGQSMFSLDFVVPNYIAGNHNTFAYKLDGFDKEWYRTTDLRTVSYSNLPAGTYRFLVKAANNDGKWNETPTALEITVLPVWYKTWWARLLFAAVFIAAATFIIRHFWQRKLMKAQLQIERMDKEKQREVNEMKLRFFINISHELRTPLTLILAPLQDAMGKVKDPWLRRQLEHVQRNTNRLLHLVNQLMDYRRAELGVFELKVRRNLIHGVIEKDFLFYERLAQRKGITYTFHSELEGCEILCDPHYLDLIANNLLSNAFKYTAEGQSIAVMLKEEGGQLTLQVQDTGNGIPQDKQTKIFERFYQADGEHLGSGIGLSLVQRLVELHHGRINLESRVGEGSTFTISLPTDEAAYTSAEKASAGGAADTPQVYTTNEQSLYVAEAEVPEGAEVAEDAEVPAQPEDCERKRETLLVVEDNLDILQYLSEELGKTYRVLKAENGAEALNELKEEEVDLILTDVMMPVMDGLQLCKQVKQNVNTCHIPIIILSAKADLNEQLEGMQVGADDYIPKPFSLVLLSAKINNLFRTRYRAIHHYSQSLEVEPETVALNKMDEDLLRRAKEVVEKHIDDVDFSTDVFAREMCMSRSSLHSKMKAVTGESSYDFIRRIRLNHACKLLKEGNYNVTEVSVMVGSSSPSYFATCFKKYIGCMPSEYMKEH